MAQSRNIDFTRTLHFRFELFLSIFGGFQVFRNVFIGLLQDVINQINCDWLFLDPPDFQTLSTILTGSTQLAAVLLCGI